MKITIFTSNQPRHLAFIKKLSKISDEVHAIIEVNTVFPGSNTDFFKKSDIMQKYFHNVLSAEKKIFGNIDFLPQNVSSLILKLGDLNNLDPIILKKAIDADLIIIFGSSYIKGELIDKLVEKKAINIHMGISPYYRGSSCNFWALYDKKPELVGATVHYISKGLDSGKILFHALPKPARINSFELGMQAVWATQESLIEKIGNNELFDLIPIEQNKNLEIRYSKNIEFTDEVASDYLISMPQIEDIFNSLSQRNIENFINPSIK